MTIKQKDYWLLPAQVKATIRFHAELFVRDYENRVQFDDYKPKYEQRIEYWRVLRWLQLN